MRKLAAVSVLSAMAVAVTAAPAIEQAFAAQNQQIREQTADQQVNHVLSRLSFGARPGDVEAVRGMGVDAWIDRQLNPDKIDDSQLNQFLRISYPTLPKTATELVAEYPRPQQVTPAQRANMSAADSVRMQQMQQQMRQDQARVNQELPSAQLARAVMSERQLYEVMVQFWENHFSVFQNKGQVRYYLTDYDRDIRQHAFGNFRQLLGVVAKSPAMLFYLDNFQSAADSNRRTQIHMLCNLPASAIIRPQDGRGRVGAAGAANVDPCACNGAATGTAQGRVGSNRKVNVGDPCAGSQLARGRLLPPQQQRRRAGLNENYARELMELHTMGVDGGYTQADIIEVARAMTGWTIQNPQQNPVFMFRPEMHDAEGKVVLGTRMPAGRGIQDGEQVLDIVASHPSTAKFIATKLARRFVADSPSTALVERAAATFSRTKGDIREVVRTIVTSPEFFSDEAYRSKIKTPLELVASTMRALNALPDPTAVSAQLVNQLGQPIFGKETPNGYPDVADQWMSTGAILNRINFGTAVAAGSVPAISLDRWPSTAKLKDLSREQQVDGVISTLLAGAASADTRTILVTGKNPFLEANAGVAVDSTMAGDGMGTPPAQAAGRGRAAGRGPRPGQAVLITTGRGRGRGAVALANLPAANLQGLPQVIGLALGSPEFQRR